MKSFPCKTVNRPQQKNKMVASAKHKREGGWYLALDAGNGTMKNAYPYQNKFGEKTQNMSGIVTTAEYNKLYYCVQLLLNTYLYTFSYAKH